MMKKLSEKDKMLLLIMAAVVILGGLFMFYVKPARSDLSAAKDRVESAQSNVDTLTVQLQQLQAASSPKAGNKTVADSLRLAKAYPGSQDVPETILQLERLARQSGVTFDDGTPDAGTDIAGTTGTSFDIAITGTYFEVQDFISRLHSQVDVDPAGRLTINGRLFAITSADLQLEGGEEGDRITPSSTVNATITAIAFSRSETAPAPATTPTANTSTGGSTQ